MRSSYTYHIKNITENAEQLLIVFEYEQSHISGLPFCIKEQEIVAHYSEAYTISFAGLGTLMQIADVNLQENAWLLTYS